MANTTDKSILTAAGKALLAQLNAEEKPLIIDKMIFANVPSRPEFPQPDDVVPTEHIVHQEGVEQRGRLSEDSVIYSTTLTSSVGPFDFNWTGAYCSEYGVLVTIDHHALTPKTADQPGISGNTLVRSVVLEYKDIAEITNITVDASSWQYNATPRMKKMDDDVAQAIIDQNGKDWFIEDGFLVTPQASAFNIKAGAGYVSGNRVTLEFDRNVQVPNRPSFIYVDARREGTPTGEQVTLFDFVVTAEEKDDYTDANEVKHFVCKIAQVLGDGSVSDLRSEGESAKKSYVDNAFQQSTNISVFPETVNKHLEVGDMIPIGYEAVRVLDAIKEINIYRMSPKRFGRVINILPLESKIIFEDGESRLLAVSQNTFSTIIDMTESSVDFKNGELITVSGIRSASKFGTLSYLVTDDVSDGIRVHVLKNGKSATLINDQSYRLDLSKWGAEDDSDITTLLNSAFQYLDTRKETASRGIVSIPAGWDVFVSDEINIPVGTGFEFIGSSVTQTQSGKKTFVANSGFNPIGISVVGDSLRGPDNTKAKRASSGSFGVYVSGGVPFTKVKLKELTGFEYGGYLKDSYSSRIKIGRAYANRVNWQFQDECHASEIDCELCEYADDEGLLINDEHAVSFVHNITFKGAYQHCKKGVIAAKCYEIFGHNIYHEGNSLGDIQFGVSDGGQYERAAYNCGVMTWQSGSPVGNEDNGRGNFILNHAVGITLNGLSLLGQTRDSHNITFDGYSDAIVAHYTFAPSGQEPNINPVGGSNAKERLVYSVRQKTRIPPNNKDHISWFYDSNRIGRRFVASQHNGRPMLVDEFVGADADYKNVVQDRQFFERYDGTQGFIIDHLNRRLDLKYTAYTNTGELVTSDPNEKFDIEPCSLGDDFIRQLIESKGVIQYRLKQGESNRLHYGVNSEVLRKTAESCGKTMEDFAPYASFDIFDDKGQSTGSKSSAVRYVELIAPLMMYVYQLENRITALEPNG